MIKPSALLALLALLACSLGLVLAGCGDDDDDQATETVTVQTTSTEAAVETCPDAAVDLGGGNELVVTNITTNAGCDSVNALAADVLSRDDCVEESPGGQNICDTQGYICTTTIPSDGAIVFAVSCEDSSGNRTEFGQARN